MMRWGLIGAALVALAGCEGTMPSGAAVSGGAQREYIVLGPPMSFEQCRAKGGLIIRDQGSPMIACDSRVLGPVVPADEFDHPGAPNPA